jgi:hypothetical protein
LRSCGTAQNRFGLVGPVRLLGVNLIMKTIIIVHKTMKWRRVKSFDLVYIDKINSY